MTRKELDDILRKHEMWLIGEKGGERADLKYAYLRYANLSDANLRDADLRYANLPDANLAGANLSGADLKGANLRDSNLRDANLSGADLLGAYLRYANFRSANLVDANLRNANLSGANFYEADLCEANLEHADLSWANLSNTNLEGAYLVSASLESTTFDINEKHRLGTILREPMIGYKKCRHGVIVTLEIPKGAIVFCINGSKCRTNKAKVVAISDGDTAISDYSPNFRYEVGQEMEIDDFNLMYNVECAEGIHFFRTREEAENYEM